MMFFCLLFELFYYCINQFRNQQNSAPEKFSPTLQILLSVNKQVLAIKSVKLSYVVHAQDKLLTFV